MQFGGHRSAWVLRRDNRGFRMTTVEKLQLCEGTHSGPLIHPIAFPHGTSCLSLVDRILTGESGAALVRTGSNQDTLSLHS